MKVFIHYAREDEQLFLKFRDHFSPIERELNLEIWADNDMLAGNNTEEVIKNRLDQADCFINLISSSLIGLIYSGSEENGLHQEINEFISLKKDSALLFSIYLKACNFNGMPIGKDGILPAPEKHINGCLDVDEAFRETIEKIKQSLKAHKVKPKSTSNILLNPIDKINCDRDEQINAFTRHFKQDRQTYGFFIYGYKKQQVNSFVERMILEVIQEKAKKLRGKNNSSALTIPIIRMAQKRFVLASDAGTNQAKFLNCIREEFNGVKTSKDLLSHSNARPYTFLILDLKLYMDSTKDFLNSLTLINWIQKDFFQSETNGYPKLVLVLSIIFTKEEKGWYYRIPGKSTLKNKLVKRLGQVTSENKDFALLPELDAVKREDIAHWFRDKLYENEWEIERAIKDKFGEILLPFYNMSEVEIQLRQIVDEFQMNISNRRGL